MNRINVILLFTCLFVSQLRAQTFNAAKLDSFFNALSENDKAMGSFAIAKNGKTVYQKSIGYRLIDGDKKVPANAQTQYRIGSITKTFTATLIFQLIEQGKLTLDTKLSTYFPEIPNSKTITIGDLLAHSSGLYDYVNDVEDKEWITAPRSKAELLKAVKEGKTHFEPGKDFSYCNSGYLLLGYVIEKLTKKPYSKVVSERIFNKLGMKNSMSGISNNTGPQEAKPYQYQKAWTDVNDICFNNVIAVGDILSTPTDMLIFIEALDAGKLLSAKSLAQMKTVNKVDGTGMGLVLIPFYSKKSYGHNGGTYGSYAVLHRFEQDSLSIAICTNGMNYKLNNINIDMLNVAYNIPFQIPSFKTVILASRDLDPYLGFYTSEEMPLKITITKDNNVLRAQATGQPAFSMEAIGNHGFRFDPSDLLIEFHPEKGTFTMKQMGRTFHYHKEK
uniref:serine hydrolase domain-containing protein n=1 Tax=Pedobacter schmidteae TaxID=2201271 RepID=UPI000EAC2EA6|nr:serine hydrolase domain-containing protein [Pedobacter schmidteae]